MESCYIDASNATFGGGLIRLVGLASSELAVYNGVYAVCSNSDVQTKAFGGNTHSGNVCGVFGSTAALKADSEAQANIATWDSTYWSVGSGVPSFKTKA